MTDGKSSELLTLSGVDKVYAGNKVVSDLALTVARGEVVGLAGENGAGKSTVLSLIDGRVAPSRGTIQFRGQQLPSGWNPTRAKKAGIATVQQELSLTPKQTVAENIFVTDWPTRWGLVSYRALRSQSKALLDRLELSVDPDDLIEDLPADIRQLIEIAKGLRNNPDLLILDEATSSLDARQVDVVLGIVKELRSQGSSVVMVTHRMAEMFSVCDRLIVLKDGKLVGTRDRNETSEPEIVEMMLGRELSEVFPPKASAEQVSTADITLRINDFTVKRSLPGIDLEFKAGTITGIGGLQGQGQRELLRSIFGLVPSWGNVELHGKPVNLSTPSHAIRHGIAYVSDDRKAEGLHVAHTVSQNIALTNMRSIAPASGLFTVRTRRQRNLVRSMIQTLQIKATAFQEVRRLSGGNQQKVALAKWLPAEPQILLLAEPTRGIDVGTKREIYRLLREQADKGKTIIITSGDTLELIGLCDEVAVMYEGRIVELLTGDAINESNLVTAAVTGQGSRKPSSSTAAASDESGAKK